MLILILSYLADLIFGQPPNFLHPVKAIGLMIEKFENKFNKGQNALLLRVKGSMMGIVVIGIVVMLAYATIKILNALNPLFGLIASVYIAYTSFTIKGLIKSSNDIFNNLKENSLIDARKNLAGIVTRDTKNLNEKHIIKSTIESTAENLNDSVVAPLFYLIIGGPVMAICYRTVNTLDAMVGYKNERYRDFGMFSAKLDDVLNFIPARITGILICAAASILEHNGRNALKIMLRDGGKHESPNAGISEAAMAGALGIKLGGCYSYPDGVKRCKDEIGEDKAEVEKNLIKKCIKISLAVSVFMLIIGIGIKICMFIAYL